MVKGCPSGLDVFCGGGGQDWGRERELTADGAKRSECGARSSSRLRENSPQIMLYKEFKTNQNAVDEKGLPGVCCQESAILGGIPEAFTCLLKMGR